MAVVLGAPTKNGCFNEAAKPSRPDSGVAAIDAAKAGAPVGKPIAVTGGAAPDVTALPPRSPFTVPRSGARR
jgi:hypothetical protein